MSGRSHARVAATVRRLRPDRHPLRRTVGRVEAAVCAGLAVVLLAGTSFAAIAARHFASDRLAGLPPQMRRVRGQPELAPMLAFLALCVIALHTGGLASRALDRRRLAAWEADWRTIEPQWSGR